MNAEIERGEEVVETQFTTAQITITVWNPHPGRKAALLRALGMPDEQLGRSRAPGNSAEHAIQRAVETWGDEVKAGTRIPSTTEIRKGLEVGAANAKLARLELEKLLPLAGNDGTG